MSTLQVTNSSNSTSITGVYFAGVSPTASTLPWNQDLKINPLKEEFFFFQSLINLSEQLTSGFVEWNTSPPLPKPKRHISSELALIKAELIRRRAAGAFDKNISLANRYARPGVSYSDEEIQATLREIRSQWEQDLDDLSGPG